MRNVIPFGGKMKKENLNLHSLSEKSGVAYSTVYNLFMGKKSIRDAKTESVYKIANALNVSMDSVYSSFVQIESENRNSLPDFTLMWENEEMGKVRIAEKSVHIEGYKSHPVKQIFYKDELSRFEFGEVLRNRCWDKNRTDIDNLLNKLGLNSFNIFQICFKTHGRMVQDKTWFRFEGETLRFEDLKG